MVVGSGTNKRALGVIPFLASKNSKYSPRVCPFQFRMELANPFLKTRSSCRISSLSGPIDHLLITGVTLGEYAGFSVNNQGSVAQLSILINQLQ
jgi:hypothetical protein